MITILLQEDSGGDVGDALSDIEAGCFGSIILLVGFLSGLGLGVYAFAKVL